MLTIFCIVIAIVWTITGLNVPTWCKATHYYANSSRNSSRLKIAGVNWPLFSFFTKTQIECETENPHGVQVTVTKWLLISESIWTVTHNYPEVLFSFSEVSFFNLLPTYTLYQIHKLSWNFFQTSFWGLSGHIKFDNFGLRTNYRLNLLEVSLSRGLARVTNFHNIFLNFKIQLLFKFQNAHIYEESIVSTIEQT